MRGSSVGLGALLILSQIRIESPFSVGWSVVRAQATRRVGNICVSATSVVDVNDGLGVDVSEVVGWSLFQESESTY